MRKNVILLVIIGTLFGCSKYDYDNSELNNSEFQPYLNSFLEEAKSRGYNINANNINFYLADIENENVGGLCNQRKGEIIIDREGWKTSNEKIKEFLIFHELGHCINGRDHRNETSESGECLSIMDGKENNFSCSKNLHSTLWKEYYLDELFNKNTVLPNWYTDNQEYVSSYSNQIEIVSIVDLNTNQYSTSFDLSNKEKYVIEFTFKNWASVASAVDDVFVRTNIYFGGIYYLSTPLSLGQHISIRGEDIGVFFNRNEYSFKNDIKLTIKKNGGLLQFFIDEQFMHAMEVKPFKNNLIEASFDVPINMDINIFEFE